MKNLEGFDFGQRSESILFLIENLLGNSSFVPFGNGVDGGVLSVKFPSRSVKSVKIRLQSREILHLQRVDFLSSGQSVLATLDLEQDVECRQSSVYKDDLAFSANKLLQKQGIFHSKKEVDPWVELVFARPVNIDEIVIHNFNPEYFYRAFGVAVFLADDNEDYRCVHDNWKAKKALINLIDSMHTVSSARLERLVLLAAVSAAFCDLPAIEDCLGRVSNFASDTDVKSLIVLINKFLAFSGYGFNQHGLIRPFGLMSASNLERVARELSKLILDVKKKLGYELVLTSGTLLGAYRDKGFIPHDDDIDVAVLLKSKNDQDAMLERARFLESLNDIGISSVDSKHVQIQCKLPSGINVDFFPAWQSAEGYALSPLPRGVLSTGDVLPVATIDMYGTSLPVPKNIEKVLVNNYGSQWNRPNPGWRFDWDRANQEYRLFIGEGK